MHYQPKKHLQLLEQKIKAQKASLLVGKSFQNCKLNFKVSSIVLCARRQTGKSWSSFLAEESSRPTVLTVAKWLCCRLRATWNRYNVCVCIVWGCIVKARHFTLEHQHSGISAFAAKSPTHHLLGTPSILADQCQWQWVNAFVISHVVLLTTERQWCLGSWMYITTFTTADNNQKVNSTLKAKAADLLVLTETKQQHFEVVQQQLV